MGVETMESIFAPELLAGRTIAGSERWSEVCGLGGIRTDLPVDAPGDDGNMSAFDEWAQGIPALDVVIVEPDPAAVMERALDAAWATTRAAASAHWIDRDRSGVVLIVGPLAAGARCEEEVLALRYACENFARTLSIEWARYGIRTTAVLPGATTTAPEVTATLAFLASPAADYWSGCVVELGGAAPSNHPER